MASRQCKRCTNLAYGTKRICETCAQLCSHCHIRPRAGSSRCYCNECRAAYNRGWVGDKQEKRRLQGRARGRINALMKAGVIVPSACEVCGEPKTIRFFISYDPPQIAWLCRPHHTERWEKRHVEEKAARQAALDQAQSGGQESQAHQASDGAAQKAPADRESADAG
jgi:hypothetical protein